MMCLCNLVEQVTSKLPGSKAGTRNEGYPMALAIVDHIVPLPTSKAVPVLYGTDGNDVGARSICSRVTLDNAMSRILPSCCSWVSVSTGTSKGMTGSECATDRRRCDQAGVFQTAFDGLTQVSWTGIVRPLIWTGLFPAAFGGDGEICWIWRQCLGDQLLADAG